MAETQEILNSVFVSRTKIGHYYSIPDSKRTLLLEFFEKNPYPKKEELEEMSTSLNLNKYRIQNWFKYQRQKDFKSSQSLIKSYKVIKNDSKIINYKTNRKFPRESKNILEFYFRKNNVLDDKTLNKLTEIIKCEKIQIERWFYYRNKKFSRIMSLKDKEKENLQQVAQEKEKLKQLELIFDYNERIGRSLFSKSIINSQFNYFMPQINPMFNLISKSNQFLFAPFFQIPSINPEIIKKEVKIEN